MGVPLKVYVAAPYDDAALVRAMHDGLRLRGIAPTSHWAEEAHGPEDFSRFDLEDLRRCAKRNHDDVREADVVLVVAKPGAGGEMFVEFATALAAGKAIVWTGLRRILSSFDERVLYVPDLHDAMACIDRMVAHHATGLRGERLARAVTP